MIHIVMRVSFTPRGARDVGDCGHLGLAGAACKGAIIINDPDDRFSPSRHLARRRRAHALRRVDGPLAGLDAIELSVPVIQHMLRELEGTLPDFMIWGSVVPNLAYSNIAREILMTRTLHRRSPRSRPSSHARPA
jgi:hypothetical protein